MRNKKLLASLLVSSIILMVSVTALAETSDTTTQTTVTVIQAPTVTTDTATQTITTQPAPITLPTAEDQKLASAIAKTYGVTVTAEEVANLHATGVGYGEISKGYGFAALSGKTVSNVLSMKQSMGWGEIAQSLGVKVSDVTRNDEAVQHAVNTSKGYGKTANQNAQNTTHSGNSNGGNSGGHSGGNGGGHK